MLTVLQKAPTRTLVTLTKVRDRLLDGDTSEDAALQDLIRDASAVISEYLAGTGANLGLQKYQALLEASGRRRLLLPRRPVEPQSVTVTIDGEAVTDWSVEDAQVGILYRATGWPRRKLAVADDSEAYITVSWRAGYVLPDMVRTWASDLSAPAAGDWIRPTSAPLSPLLFEVTTAGAVGQNEPTWPTTAGETVADGAVVYTAREVEELPETLQTLAYLEVYHRYERDRQGLWTSRLTAEGVDESIPLNLAAAADLYPAVKAGLDRMAEVRIA